MDKDSVVFKNIFGYLYLILFLFLTSILDANPPEKDLESGHPYQHFDDSSEQNIQRTRSLSYDSALARIPKVIDLPHMAADRPAHSIQQQTVIIEQPRYRKRCFWAGASLVAVSLSLWFGWQVGKTAQSFDSMKDSCWPCVEILDIINQAADRAGIDPVDLPRNCTLLAEVIRQIAEKFL